MCGVCIYFSYKLFIWLTEPEIVRLRMQIDDSELN